MVVKDSTLDEETDTFLEARDTDEARARFLRSLRKARRTRNLLFLTNLFTLVSVFYATWYKGLEPTLSCVQQLTTPSPALEVIPDESYVTTDWNSTNHSPYRGGSDESDAHWRDIMRVGALGFSAEDLKQAGASLETSIRLPPESGGQYMGYLQFLHEIHCLYKIHQYLEHEYYDGRSKFWEMSDYLRRDHVGHCIEYLRQTTLCHADVSVMTFQWVNGLSKPIPSQSPRKCRDWQAVHRWASDRQVEAPAEPLHKTDKTVVLDDPPNAYYLATDKNLSGIENL